MDNTGQSMQESHVTTDPEDANLTAKVAEIICTFVVDTFLFGEEDGLLSPDGSFLETGIIDSTGMLELVSFIEVRFGIAVEDEEMLPSNLDSLNRVSAYVVRKLHSEPQGSA